MKVLKWLSVVVLAVGVGLLWSGCDGGAPGGEEHEHEHGEHEHGEHEGHDHEGHAEHGEEVHLSAEAIERSGIKVETIGKRALAQTIAAPARVEFNANRTAHVVTPLTGRVIEIHATVGDRVKQGDPLLTLNSPELAEAQSDFLLKQAQALAAEPTVALTRSAHERAAALFEQSGGIAQSEVQSRLAEWKAAESQLTMARAAATTAENLLHILGMTQEAVDALKQTSEVDARYTLRAPIEGTIIEHHAALGELAGPDRESLMMIADLSLLWVLADVPESRIGGIASGAKARIMLAALPEEAFEGVVSHVDSRVQAETRTVAVRVEAPNASGALRPGMFAVCMIEAGAKTQAVLAVPEAAIQTIEGEAVVFAPCADEPGGFIKREIEIGERVGDMVPILAGLEEGELVVTSGSFMLKAELGKASAEHVH